MMAYVLASALRVGVVHFHQPVTLIPVSIFDGQTGRIRIYVPFISQGLHCNIADPVSEQLESLNNSHSTTQNTSITIPT